MMKVFSVLLIALDVAAAVVCATCGDWQKFFYWLAAATWAVAATI